MKISRFEDLLSWQVSKDLTKSVYRMTLSLKDYGFSDQIRRAAVSIMNNIAEGFERRGDKEFIHFLSIAKGSCGEVRSMLQLGYELGYFSEQDLTEQYAKAVRTSSLIAGLIRSLYTNSAV